MLKHGKAQMSMAQLGDKEMPIRLVTKGSHEIIREKLAIISSGDYWNILLKSRLCHIKTSPSVRIVLSSNPAVVIPSKAVSK